MQVDIKLQINDRIFMIEKANIKKLHVHHKHIKPH